MMKRHITRGMAALGLGLVACTLALADEAAIRKNLPQRVPNLPPIDEVVKTAIPGVYEVRIGGTEIIYSDEQADHVFQGNLIDTRTRSNLTEARMNKLTAVEFDKLPLKDAIVWKSGTGARKLAVFADPNCGYCKRLETDLQKLKNVTIYTFLIPVLGADSAEKSKDIWCSKDPTKAWLGWMLEGKRPEKSAATCENPLERNLAVAQKHRINGTPALIFTDNTRVPGAIGLEEIEKRLGAASVAGSAAPKS